MVKLLCRGTIMLTLVGLTLGCGRIVDEPKSTLVLELPNLSKKGHASTLSEDTPDTVFITLSNKDKTLPRHHRLNGHSSLELEVPRGATRILQVVALYPGIFNTIQAYHGVTEFTADSDSIVLQLTLSPLGDLVAGEIGGRILSHNSSPLTGGLVASLHIRADLAPIEIERSNIIGGWFKAIGLVAPGILGVEYNFQSQFGPISLFRGPKQFTDFSDSNSIAHLYVPRYQEQPPDHMNAMINPREPRIHVLGMWALEGGAAPATRVHHEALNLSDSPSPSMQTLKCRRDNEACVSSSHFSIVTAHFNSAEDAAHQLLRTDAAEHSNAYDIGTSNIFRSGGTSSPCSESEKWITCLDFQAQHWNLNESSRLMGNFAGAFRYKSATGSECGSNIGSCSGFMLPLENTLKTLPGISASAIRAFYLPLDSSIHDQDDETTPILCDRGQLINLGFRDLPGVSLNSDLTEVTLPRLIVEREADSILICGSFNGREIPVPIVIGREHLGLPYSSGGVGMAPISITAVKFNSTHEFFNLNDLVELELHFSQPVTLVGGPPVVTLSNNLAIPLMASHSTNILRGTLSLTLPYPDTPVLTYASGSLLHFTNPGTDKITGLSGQEVDYRLPPAGVTGIKNLTGVLVGMDFSPPSGPSNLNYTSSIDGIQNITFAESVDNGPSGIFGYEVKVSDNSTNIIQNWTPILIGGSLNGLNLMPGVSYTIKIRAKDKAGNYSPETLAIFSLPSP